MEGQLYRLAGGPAEKSLHVNIRFELRHEVSAPCYRGVGICKDGVVRTNRERYRIAVARNGDHAWARAVHVCQSAGNHSRSSLDDFDIPFDSLGHCQNVVAIAANGILRCQIEHHYFFGFVRHKYLAHAATLSHRHSFTSHRLFHHLHHPLLHCRSPRKLNIPAIRHHGAQLNTRHRRPRLRVKINFQHLIPLQLKHPGLLIHLRRHINKLLYPVPRLPLHPMPRPISICRRHCSDSPRSEG
mmetsp:Transcript_49934/g.122614  ORF Transcript_49934/g.122614 Transcript_49934/m.122614 type:complete len:242 (+) Transcript_49934:754-1479(+)